MPKVINEPSWLLNKYLKKYNPKKLNEFGTSDNVQAHHEDELARKLGKKGMEEIGNFGADTGPYHITSKTPKGMLHTEIDPKTNKIRHTWDSSRVSIRSTLKS